MIWSAPFNIIASFFSYCLGHIPLYFSFHPMFLCHFMAQQVWRVVILSWTLVVVKLRKPWLIELFFFISHLFSSSFFLTKAYCFGSFLAQCWSNWNDYPASVKYFSSQRSLCNIFAVSGCFNKCYCCYFLQMFNSSWC